MTTWLDVETRISEILQAESTVTYVDEQTRRKFSTDDLDVLIITPDVAQRQRLTLAGGYIPTRQFMVIRVYAVLADDANRLPPEVYQAGWAMIEEWPAIFAVRPLLSSAVGGAGLPGVLSTGIMEDSAPLVYPYEGGVYAAIMYTLPVTLEV